MKVTRGDIVYLKNPIPAREHIQGGVRPYVVISNDRGNKNSNICIIVPLTTAWKRMPLPTHTRINYHNSLCLCEQIFTVSQNDIHEVVYHLSRVQMQRVTNCLIVSIGGDLF